MFSKPQKKWTAADIDLCIELRRSGQTVQQIADFMERSYHSVDGYLRRDTIERARQNRIRNENRRYLPHAVTKVIIPAFVIAERDKRANEPRSLSMTMFGDPPFSQSALAMSLKVGES